MRREPDFSSKEFDTAVEAKIDEVVGRHALRVLHWIIGGIIGASLSVIGAAIWASRVYYDIQHLIVTEAKQDLATQERIATWSAWRQDMDAHLRAIDGRTGDRWTRGSMRDYSSQLGYLNPALKMPDPDIIANRQTAP